MIHQYFQDSNLNFSNDYLLKRPRLLSVFDHAAKHPCVFVMAGAGYGKSQAAADYCTDKNIMPIWLDLTDLDNLPQRFWERFIQACSEKNPVLGKKLDQFKFPKSLSDYHQFISTFTAQLYKEKNIIIFDNMHLIYEQKILSFISSLISAKINHTSIFLLSREFIDSNFIKINTHTLIYSITMHDLKFTVEECRQLFEQKEKKISSASVKRIHAFTEGWPMILQIIASTIENEKLYLEKTDTYAKPIFLYFENQIFSQFPAEEKNIMIKLSLLGDFNLFLLKQVAGDKADDLQHRFAYNMFIQYNPQKDIYHFHNLFSYFLVKKQFLLNEEDTQDVYYKTAVWYEENDDLTNAMKYYLKCQSYEKLMEICKNLPLHFQKRMGQAVVNTIDQFPEDILQKYPLVQVMKARLLLNNDQLPEAVSLLKNMIREEASSRIIGECYLILGFVNILLKKFDYNPYFSFAEECLPGGSILCGPSNLFNNGNYTLYLGSSERGEIEKFEKSVERLMPVASRVMNGCGYGIEYLIKAEIAYYKTDREKAALNAYETIYRARSKDQADLVLMAYFTLLRIAMMKGNYSDCLKHLAELKEYGYQVQNGRCSHISELGSSWFFIKIGHPELVADWILADEDASQICGNRDNREFFVRADCYLKQENYPALLAYLNYLDSFYEGKKLLNADIELNILKAIAFHKTDQADDAIFHLEKAYTAAADNGLFMQFIEYGNYMRNLLNTVIQSGSGKIPAEWLNDMHRRASTYSKRINFVRSKYEVRTNEEEQPIPLSPMEKEILNCLAQGLTREEIAAANEISINTIKSHLRNIYSKLGAVNRADAIRIASAKKVI